jgi:glutathione synthase/RimK-type ligase-like ATP-grasp enzyme
MSPAGNHAVDVLIASCRDLPDGAPDDRMLMREIVRLGGTADIAAWNDPAVDWSRGRMTIVRSTWDYHTDIVDWRAWIDRVARQSVLVNAAATLHWNSNKRYLLDLANAGVPVVPTEIVRADELATLPDLIAQRAWRDVIVKPTIGAGAVGTRRFVLPQDKNDLIAHAKALSATDSILLQPFQSAVLDACERSLVYIGGRFQHAFTKPAFHPGISTGGNPEVSIAPSQDERVVAESALSIVVPQPPYARVDLVPSANGPLVMEVELIEPHLAFGLHPASCAELARKLMAETYGRLI